MELDTPQTEEEFLAAIGIPFNRIDVVEAMIKENLPRIDCPLVHRFTPGIYTREIFMPAGTLLTSKIHNTEHPYVISKGVVEVWTENEGSVMLQAPYTGITKPGTRRVLFVREDTIWTTFHATDKTDIDAIEDDIIMKHTNPLLAAIPEQQELIA